MNFRDEDCQGCRRNRNTDRPNAIEIMFANDVTLVLSAKSKTEQDEWLNAIMKGLSQGVCSYLTVKQKLSSSSLFSLAYGNER